MINRIVCKALLLTNWVNHGSVWTARICICDNTKKDQQGRNVFIKAKAFNKTGELLSQYTSKHSVLYIDGRLDMDTFEKKDGSKGNEYAIVIDKVEWEWRDKIEKQSNLKKEEDIPF